MIGTRDTTPSELFSCYRMAGSGKTTMMKALSAHFSRPATVGSPPLRPAPPKPSRKYSDNSDSDSEHSESHPIESTGPMDKMEDIGYTTPESNRSEPQGEEIAHSSEKKESSCRTRDKLRTYIINLDPAVR